MGRSAFVFEAGNLALDLVNTRAVAHGELVDKLTSPEELDAWLSAAGLQEAGVILELGSRTRRRLVGDARALRGAVETLAEGARSGSGTDSSALQVVNDFLAGERVSTQLRAVDGHFEAVRISHAVGEDAVLSPVAAAAVELLTGAPDRIRQCGDETCVLWFLDKTRNGRRRWCSMARCGNRAKAATHYRRRKRRRDPP